MYIRFLFNIGECIYLVSFWGYKKYIPYFISLLVLGLLGILLRQLKVSFIATLLSAAKERCPLSQVSTATSRLLFKVLTSELLLSRCDSPVLLRPSISSLSACRISSLGFKV